MNKMREIDFGVSNKLWNTILNKVDITHEICYLDNMHGIHAKIYGIISSKIDFKTRNKMWEKLELMNGSISEHVCDQIEGDK